MATTQARICLSLTKTSYIYKNNCIIHILYDIFIFLCFASFKLKYSGHISENTVIIFNMCKIADNFSIFIPINNYLPF